MESDSDSEYEIKKVIGKGNFGKVLLGISKQTGEKVAIKIIDKLKMSKFYSTEQIKRELNVIQQMNHLNIVKIYKIEDNKKKYKIIMEYCEKGELYEYIVEKKYLKEEEAAYFYFQLINGLEYIHSKNIVHRDLKPENLLITNNKILKIIDFGLSNYHDVNNYLSTPCGSPSYASPEMVSGKKYNGVLVDIWCTGIILYAMLYGYLPFEAKDNYSLFKKIIECKIQYPNGISKAGLDLMKKILINDPSKRIRIEQIKLHPFYLEGKKIFNSIHQHYLNHYEKRIMKKMIPNNYNHLNGNYTDRKGEGKKTKKYFKKEPNGMDQTSYKKNTNDSNLRYKKHVGGTFKKNILCFNISNENNDNNNQRSLDEDNNFFKAIGIFKKKNILNNSNKRDYNEYRNNLNNICYTENNNDIIRYIKPVVSPINSKRKKIFEEKYFYNSQIINNLNFYERNSNKMKIKNKNYSPPINIFGPYKRPTLFERSISLKKAYPNKSRNTISSSNKMIRLNNFNLNLYTDLNLSERHSVFNTNKFNRPKKEINNKSVNDSFLYKHKSYNSTILKDDKYVYEKKNKFSRPSEIIIDKNNNNELNIYYTLSSSRTVKNSNNKKNIVFMTNFNKKTNDNQKPNRYIHVKNIDSIKDSNNNYLSDNNRIHENDDIPLDYIGKTLDNSRNNYVKKNILKINKYKTFNRNENELFSNKTISQHKKKLSKLLNFQDHIFIKKRITSGNTSTKNKRINQTNNSSNTLQNKRIKNPNLPNNKNINTVIFNNQINQLNIYKNDNHINSFNINSLNFYDKTKSYKNNKLNIKIPKEKNEFKTIIINKRCDTDNNNDYQSISSSKKIIKKNFYRPLKNRNSLKNMYIKNNMFKLKKESFKNNNKYKAFKINNIALSNSNKNKYRSILLNTEINN